MTTKALKHQKGLTVYNLKDISKELAQSETKIFYQAWLDYHELQREKRRKELKKRLDKRLKK